MKKAQSGKYTDGHRNLLFCFFLIVVTVLVYARIAHHEFLLFDDNIQLTDQVHVLSGLTWNNFLWSFSRESWCGPVTWLAYATCYEIFGLNPGAFHVMSLAFHSVSGVLLFFVLERMTGAFWRSALVSTLFAIHPANVESVAWVAELNNVVSGLFFMLTLLAYHYYARRPGMTRYLASLLLFCLGMLAKPAIMTLPFILLLLDFWPLHRIRLERDGGRTVRISAAGRSIPRLLLEKIPFLTVTFISLIYNLTGAEMRMGLYGAEQIPFGLRASNAIVSFMKYLGLLFWPHGQSIFYPYPAVIPLWQVLCSAAVLLLLIFIAFRLIFRSPYLVVGLLWFLGGLVPFLGISQAGLWPEMADRYAYLTFIGIFIIISWGSYDLFGSWKMYRFAASTLSAVIIPILMILAWNQAGYWKNSEILFSRALALRQDNFLAHNVMGLVYYQEGDYERSLVHLRESLVINPAYYDAVSNLGIVLYTMKRYGEAEEQFLRCIRINPLKPTGYTNLGHTLMDSGRSDEAIKMLEHSLSIDPNQGKAAYRLGEAYTRKGNFKKAISSYQQSLIIGQDIALASKGIDDARALQAKQEETVLALQKMVQLNPGDLNSVVSLGKIYRQMGRYSESIAQYQQALILKPGFPPFMYELALAHSDAGDYQKALDVLQDMQRMSPDNPTVYYNIACVYAKQNKPDEAVSSLKMAISKGFDQLNLIDEDPDLANIRNTPFAKELSRGK